MVDMMAGVIFILIILLVSVALVAREDFVTTEAAQREIQRIEADLQRARSAEQSYLEPRQRAKEAAMLLLSRVRDELVSVGITATLDPELSLLRVARTAFFNNGLVLSDDGDRAATTLAAVLARYLPCVTDAPKAPECAEFPVAHVDRMVIAVHGPNPGASAAVSDPMAATSAQALNLYARIVRERPMLIGLHASEKQPVLGYRGFGERYPAAGMLDGRIDLLVSMDVPALPAAQ
jgi:hypothetical protein